MKNKGLVANMEYRFGDARVGVYIKNHLPESVPIQQVMEKVQAAIPSAFMGRIDFIYIGQFDDLNKRQIESLYIDGAIYITNEQKSVQGMVTSIVHEVAHSIESNYKNWIYGDGRLSREYLGKRNAALDAVERYIGTSVPEEWRADIDYDPEFDVYLYDTVGYDVIRTLASNIFMSPYAMTSVREYFADAFEEFTMGRTHDLKQLCPVVYEKIEGLY